MPAIDELTVIVQTVSLPLAADAALAADAGDAASAAHKAAETSEKRKNDGRTRRIAGEVDGRQRAASATSQFHRLPQVP